MTSTVSVEVHPSQFPERVQKHLVQCLRERRIAPKFHYQSYKQSQKWQAVYEAWSPFRNDSNCAEIYDQAFVTAAELGESGSVRVVGLGCGTGDKEARLLGVLAREGREVSYSPCDTSLGLVLTAEENARRAAPSVSCSPVLCDFAVAEDLSSLFGRAEERRIFTLFGIIPNLEPGDIVPRLVALLRRGDVLLFSANLAPGRDYAKGMKRILPGYDNAETRDWLLTFLFDLGVERDDGTMEIGIEDAGDFKRVVADFHFARERELNVLGERTEFRADEVIRLFFSYRYRPEMIAKLAGANGLKIAGQWISNPEEEGVFACQLD
jgi:uncharacterized SAM-dependent methyltransferase